MRAFFDPFRGSIFGHFSHYGKKRMGFKYGFFAKKVTFFS
jgi:hypothetical protein